MFSNLRRVSLYLYIIIFFLSYTVEILANPVTLIQKRQGGGATTIISLTTSTITKSNPAASQSTQRETYSPSKPRNCNGPIKFSKVEVIPSDPNNITFIAKGKTSENIVNATGNF